ncbi:glucoside xylosyltransferase 1 isoform X2 [Parasteatoda tepidariorum]|uniref:glucoside xylosyltransferase 1 isoform X2 n=1 Tax=Parasteatoda tepidariorum TaxID=114398 RepID=UPI001C728E9E|nr:glucoside xylosyltransferase 1 isoform X2 [Parasteatoda tepidariorum]
MIFLQRIQLYSKLVILLLFISTIILYLYVTNKSPYLKYSILSPDRIVNKDFRIHFNQNNDSSHKGLFPSAKNLPKTNSNLNKMISHENGNITRYGNGTEMVKLAVVLCGDRLNQTLITLKSALIFSKAPLHFIIVLDEDNRQLLKEKILKWPEKILKRISFEIHPISFPLGEEGNEWKKLFKLCACQRLFLPSLLRHIDSLLYVDTDVVFIHPVEDLWLHFSKMNNSQIAALSPEHEDFATGWYNRFARHPFYEPLGVNSGVMLMNLTRMRAFQWEKYLTPILKEYKLNIVWGDQDIINIIFHFHPDKLYIFPCAWNFRPDHCMYSSVCSSAKKDGIAIIHGNRGVFYNNKQPVFKFIYKEMQQHIMNEQMLHRNRYEEKIEIMKYFLLV